MKGENIEKGDGRGLRLPEMDVMKGLLTVMVVFGHIINMEQVVSGVQIEGHAAQAQNIFVAVWIASYYMAAFFFVTGFCSSFRSDIRTQMVTDAKRLLLPALIIPLVMALVMLLGDGIGWYYYTPWFLWSMFWSRLLFKLIRQFIGKAAVAWLLMLAMSAAGAIMMHYMPETNCLGWQQTLVFTLFLALGNKARSLNPNWLVYALAGAFYALAATTMFYRLLWGVPAVCAIITFTPEKWPLYVLLALSGTLGILGVSKLLSWSKIMQYIGRHSLVFYLVHGAFLVIVSSYIRDQIIANNGNSTFQHTYFVLMSLGALLWSALWAELFNMPYLRLVLGKSEKLGVKG